eukprot:6567707-Alexandrium_andersonii.AAC.1
MLPAASRQQWPRRHVGSVRFWDKMALPVAATCTVTVHRGHAGQGSNDRLCTIAFSSMSPTSKGSHLGKS